MAVLTKVDGPDDVPKTAHFAVIVYNNEGNVHYVTTYRHAWVEFIEGLANDSITKGRFVAFEVKGVAKLKTEVVVETGTKYRGQCEGKD